MVPLEVSGNSLFYNFVKQTRFLELKNTRCSRFLHKRKIEIAEYSSYRQRIGFYITDFLRLNAVYSFQPLSKRPRNRAIWEYHLSIYWILSVYNFRLPYLWVFFQNRQRCFITIGWSRIYRTLHSRIYASVGIGHWKCNRDTQYDAMYHSRQPLCIFL